MKKIIFFVFIFCQIFSQDLRTDSEMLKAFYDESLLSGKSYSWLDYLTNRIGSRLSGSLGAERAIQWTKSELNKLELDNVFLQPVLVPKWVRGPKEFALIETSPGITFNVPITALGGSVATPSVGLKANVVEVNSIDDLSILGKERIEGKIVFFNRPMHESHPLCCILIFIDLIMNHFFKRFSISFCINLASILAASKQFLP